MIRKKSSFLTFCFSMIPGAGQMYMGFMKRGLSLMSLFAAVIFLSAWLNMGPILALIPIIWFYAFFDTHNLRSMPDDEFYAMEDEYVLLPDLSKEKAKLLQTKYRTAFAVVLIVVGVTILWNNMYDMIRFALPDYLSYALSYVGRYIPQLFVSVAIIALGIHLIRGKKRDLDALEKDQFLEDKGGIL